jgi:hypothetical protein
MELTIPTSWADITLGTYQKVARLMKEATQIEDVTDVIKFEAEIIAALCGLDEQTIDSIPLREFGRIKQKTSFIYSLPEAAPIHTLKIDGTWFSAMRFVKDLNAGNFFDLTHYQQNIEDNMHLFLSIVLRDSEWTIDKSLDNAEMFKKHMTAKDAITLSLFFWAVYATFTRVTEAYSMEDKALSKIQMTKIMTGIKRNTDGWYGLTDWQNMIGQSGIIS